MESICQATTPAAGKRNRLPRRDGRIVTFGPNTVIFGLMTTSGAGLVAHSGGPTAVINASLLGVVEEARRHAALGALYGARFGIAGILRGEFIDLFAQPEATLRAVADAPASALGTSRLEVSADELERALAAMRERDIRYFFYTGGNGSMGTASQMERVAREIGYELHVIGIPKTIDNDLTATDHTPGYPEHGAIFRRRGAGHRRGQPGAAGAGGIRGGAGAQHGLGGGGHGARPQSTR